MSDGADARLPQPSGPECERQMGANEIAEPGQRLHVAALILGQRAYVKAMAEEFDRPLDEVARLYCKELSDLRSQATVLDYLPVLVSKRLRALLKKTSGLPPN